MPLDTLGVGAVCLSSSAPTSSWHDNDIVWRAWLKRSRITLQQAYAWDWNAAAAWWRRALLLVHGDSGPKLSQSAVLGAWLMGMHCSEGCRASGGSFREIARLCSVHPEGARSIGQASTAHRLNCLAPRPEEPDWLARLFCLSLCPTPTTC